MLQRDYILRIIEQFIASIHRALGLAANQQHAEAHAELEELLRELTGLTSDKLLDLTAEQILDRIQLLAPEGAQQSSLAATIAALNAHGEIFAAHEMYERAYLYHLKTMDLALVAAASDATWIGQQSDWSQLIPALEQLATSVLQAHVRSRRFAEGEDLIFGWLDRLPGSPDLLQSGIAFYRSLQQLDDDQLAGGGLPRNEVNEGMAELLEMSYHR
jgi:hypothetical protein